jgi:hypothetical protein
MLKLTPQRRQWISEGPITSDVGDATKHEMSSVGLEEGSEVTVLMGKLIDGSLQLPRARL